MTRLIRRLRRRDRSRGQSLVEFALVLPLILFLVMIGLDFGRVYLGYVNLQNMARIAANYAANNPTAWTSPGDTAAQTQYRNQILNDAKATNCTLPQISGVTTVPAPTFTDAGGNGRSTDVGDSASVSLTCTFRIATPIISGIVGTNGNLSVSATAVFPVKKGLIGTSGGGGSAPSAEFIGTPTSGVTPLVVQFTDQSTGSPTTWAWDFNADGLVDSSARDPQWTFSAVGLHTVTLVASNSNGSSTRTRTNYISVGTAPAGVNFTASPTSGARPLTVQFTDTSTGSPTSWAWDFDNNGTVDSTVQNPTYTYSSAGVYSVRLTATNLAGPASRTIANMITVTVGTCTVPNFAGTSTSNAQATWSAAGFTTNVNFQQGNLPWTIASQNQVVGQTLPCSSSITVSKN
jgi:PKD repeat protein